ncbi:MAG: SH3 domain-containing protein [Gemmataceae bacterium]|nr:SH3 domain-containing protein [Gemmata sp.]MDW8196805.1 SH3 domain-containing protein [Gemmataceae bacterium]
MRGAAFVGLVAGVIAGPIAAAEPAMYRAVVTESEVKMRAGPSDSFPETGTLHRDQVVIVEREENNGWLAITAPHDAVSWIAFAFVEDLAPQKPTPKNGFVHSEGEVTIAAGKPGEFQPLHTRRQKIPQGTRVLLIGPPVEFAGKKWWPIAPPPGDVRYIPKTAVRFDQPHHPHFTVRITESNTSGSSPGATSSTAPTNDRVASSPSPSPLAPAQSTPPRPAIHHPLWTQAEAAERDNRLADAEKAYFELAALMNGPGGDHDIANLCYTRIHALREKKRNTLASQPLAPGVPPPAKDDRGVRPGTPQPLPAADSRSNTTRPSQPTDPRGQWSGPGMLLRSAVTLDGLNRKTYLLESSPGEVKMYVLAAPGVDLEKYLGQRVEVYGVLQTRPGLKKPYMEAFAVEAAR